MREIDENCIQRTEDSNIKFEENGKKIIFVNSNKKICYKIQVDGCAIRSGVRCDKLLKVGDFNKDGKEYYVELKGSDVLHAVDQIYTSIKMLHNDNSLLEGFIIFSNMSPKFSSKIQMAKARFKKDFDAKLSLYERVHTIKI